jgi:hypothetical protein
VVGHTGKEDGSASRGINTVVENTELRAYTQSLDLILDETLRALSERLLSLTNADGASAWVEQTMLDEKLGEEPALA